MNCDEVREFLLGLDLDEAGRRRAAIALTHVDECPHCRLAMRDFDEIAVPLAASLPRREKEAVVDLMEEPALPLDISNRPTGGWGAFEKRMLAVVKGGRRRVLSSSGTFSGLFARLRIALLGTAVIVAIAVAAFTIGRRSAPPIQLASHTGKLQDPVPAELIASTDVRRQVEAFGIANEMSKGRTRWIMLAPGASDAETLPSRAAAPPRVDRVLFVRLTLSDGPNSLSSTDLVLVPGVSASVLVPFGKCGSSLAYRVTSSVSDPMNLSVHLEVPTETKQNSRASAEPSVVATTVRLEPYVNVSAGRVLTQHGAYDLRVAAAATELPADIGTIPNLRPL